MKTRIPRNAMIVLHRHVLRILLCGAALSAVRLSYAENAPATPRQTSGGFAGYISMSVPAPPDDYRYGVSLYAAAWPLLQRPLRGFQIGLASIWIVPDNRKVDYPLLPTGTVARDHWPERGPSYRDVFQTIEGGLGFWASTRFGCTTAKFRMNGTANGYNHEISSPGWGFGRTTALAPDEMGIAQLSPRLLVPPDGLTFHDGTCGELFGYAWMVLPLTRPTTTTAGLPVPTGNQCWTMFVHTRNFSGPVAFYTPVTWSRISRHYAPAAGRGLDTRPGLVTGGAIEVNTVPMLAARDADGTEYTRVPQLQFPVDAEGRTVLLQDMTFYSKDALYTRVARWLEDDRPAPTDTAFDPACALTPPCKARPLTLRQGRPQMHLEGFEKSVRTCVFERSTFGLRWQPSAIEPWIGNTRRGLFPAYFRKDGERLGAVAPDAVPDATGLRQANFAPAENRDSYTSPQDANSCWKQPGPKAGPFQARLTDGSVVTYWWYRFVDQPSLRDADLDAAARERLQAIVERIHACWTPERDYLPPPARGQLAELDTALLVTPPKGLEVGYVPIATRQAPAH